ncbi:MAG: thiamine phosphate synthase [Bacteroidales bacterium]|nr:thiamine phosphate synthase [Bacteroidales bacterium]
MFRLAIITPPETLRDEEHTLTAVCRLQGVETLHLRKPDWDLAQTRCFLEALPLETRQKIRLHDHFELQKTCSTQGIHLNGRHPAGAGDCPQSCSCHSLQEVEQRKPECDYIFLSPIFNSISKQSYKSGFSENQLREAAQNGIIDTHVLALGGVEARHIPLLKQIGFGGAAMIGGIWKEYMQNGNLRALCRNIEKTVDLCRD